MFLTEVFPLFVGMIVLSLWAIGNIFVGFIKRRNQEGMKKYFYEMNVMWNIVNLVIGIGALVGLQDIYYNSPTPQRIIEYVDWTSNVLVINIFLDIGYQLAGFWIFKKPLKKFKVRMQGYGVSLILQGAFLFVLDCMMWVFLNL